MSSRPSDLVSERGRRLTSERHQILPQLLTRLGGAHGVASGEDAGERGLHSLGVDADRTEAGDSENGRAEEDGIGLRVEAEGLDDEACRQYVLGACDGLDLLSADRVGQGEVGADRLDAVPSKEPDGGGEPGDADALLLGVGDFAEGSGHVGAVAAVEASDVGGTLANSGADAVHDGVPAPHHDDTPIAGVEGAVGIGVLVSEGVSVGGVEEGEGGDDALEITSDDPERPGLVDSGGEEDGVMAGAQVV